MNINVYYDYQAVARNLATQYEFAEKYAYHKNLYDRLLPNWLPSKHTADIYEVACGPGMLLKWMIDRGYTNIKGTDSSEPQIALAQSMGLPATLQDSLTDLAELKESSLDCVIALNFYEHLPKEVFLDFLQLCTRALKPGGRLILQGPNADSPLCGRNLYNDITHFWAYTSTSLKALLGMSGMSVVKSQDDVIEGIYQKRILKIPLAIVSRWILRSLFTAASREHVNTFGMYLWTMAEKNHD